jgi:hypothetical protein
MLLDRSPGQIFCKLIMLVGSVTAETKFVQ